MNPNKCTFSVDKLECLGYTVDAEGYQPDEKRLAPLLHVKSPTNLTELRSILGALQYYSRFISNFSEQASCLFELVSAKSFLWTDVHELTLRKLLKFLASDAILKPFSPKLHSTVITDASPYGIGGILEQEGKPVICVSGRLTKAE